MHLFKKKNQLKVWTWFRYG